MSKAIDQHTEAACDAFDALIEQHKVTRWALDLVATNEPADQLAALVRVGSGMKRSEDLAFETADQLIETAQQMRKDSWQQVRINLLVSLCAALEHAIKSYFVDGCQRRAGQQEDWESIRLDAAATTNIERSSTEIWFEIAGRRWQDDSQPVGRRVISFIRANCAVPPGKTFDAGRFMPGLNNAFALRNALLHNGGLPTPRLVKSGFGAGERISLSATATFQCVTALLGTIDALRSASDLITLADI